MGVVILAFSLLILDVTNRINLPGLIWVAESDLGLLKVPIMSKKIRSSNSAFHLMNFCEKFFSIWIIRNFFIIFWRHSNLPPFWSTIRTSLPRVEVSRDVVQEHVIWVVTYLTWKQARILLQSCLRNKAYSIVKDSHTTYAVICTKGELKVKRGSWIYVTDVVILSTLLLWSAAGVDRKKIEFWI